MLLLTTLSALSVLLFQSASALSLPCTNHRMIYEDSPDQFSQGGEWGHTYRHNGKFTTSALCTVNFPEWAAGRQCKLYFTVGSDGYVMTAPGYTQTGQIFTLGSPDISSATWNARGPANRDQRVGHFVSLASDAEAVWEGSDTFPCPNAMKGFEIVPSGDTMYASWGKSGGLTVEIL